MAMRRSIQGQRFEMNLLSQLKAAPTTISIEFYSNFVRLLLPEKAAFTQGRSTDLLTYSSGLGGRPPPGFSWRLRHNTAAVNPLASTSHRHKMRCPALAGQSALDAATAAGREENVRRPMMTASSTPALRASDQWMPSTPPITPIVTPAKARKPSAPMA